MDLKVIIFDFTEFNIVWTKLVSALGKLTKQNLQDTFVNKHIQDISDLYSLRFCQAKVPFSI